MKQTRRIARDYLHEATLTDFWEIVREAKITKCDQQILDARFVEGKSLVEISIKYGYSVEKIKKVISEGYDKVFNALNR